MKIIDLLNMISKGEEVPKVIKFLNYKYIFDTLDKEYQRYQNGVCYGFGEDRRLDIILDEEIEIIEENKEEKKIPEKLNIDLISNDENKVNYYRATNLECDLAFKINSIIDYLKSKGE